MGWSGQHSLVVDRGPDDGGQGMGFNGGQLLLLALGACFTNDVFREAAKRDLDVRGVASSSSATGRASRRVRANVRYSTRVEAEAGEDEIMELIQHVDEIAEVHGTLRDGIAIELTEAEAVSMQVETRRLTRKSGRAPGRSRPRARRRAPAEPSGRGTRARRRLLSR